MHTGQHKVAVAAAVGAAHVLLLLLFWRLVHTAPAYTRAASDLHSTASAANAAPNTQTSLALAVPGRIGHGRIGHGRIGHESVAQAMNRACDTEHTLYRHSDIVVMMINMIKYYNGGSAYRGDQTHRIQRSFVGGDLGISGRPSPAAR